MLYGADSSKPWDLEATWTGIYYQLEKPITVFSRECLGSLHQVSRVIGGKPLGTTTSKVTPIHTLLGCFVGKELSPRFLAILDIKKGEFLLYTADSIMPINFASIGIEVSYKAFIPTLENLKTRLWKI